MEMKLGNVYMVDRDRHKEYYVAIPYTKIGDEVLCRLSRTNPEPTSRINPICRFNAAIGRYVCDGGIVATREIEP